MVISSINESKHFIKRSSVANAPDLIGRIGVFARRCLFLLKAVGVFIGLSLAMLSGKVQASEYKLGPQDRIRIKVVEWRPTTAESYEWAALNGEYTVNPKGQVFLPLVGPTRAEGLNLEELSQIISLRLKERVGVLQPPDTSVEVTQYRPFYIIGSVDKPGEYSFRVGLTVLQAVGIAGGFYRPADAAIGRSTRDALVARNDMNLISTTRTNLLARRARLQAELDDGKSIEFPVAITTYKDDPAISQIMRQEDQIFRSRQASIQEQRAALGRLRSLLLEEIDSLGARINLQDRALGIVQKELKDVTGLVEKGLTVAPRQFALERAVNDIEMKRHEMETSVLRAKQDLNKAERDLVDLKSQQRNTIATDLRQTQASLDELAQKLSNADRLAYEAEVIAPRDREKYARSARDAQPIYAIVRRQDGRAVETVVSENTPVEPGDVIKVQGLSDPTAPSSETDPRSTTGLSADQTAVR